MNNKTVVVLRNHILPYSETFIFEQIKAMCGWHGVLIGLENVENGLDLSSIDSRIIPNIRNTFFRRWLFKFEKRFWLGNKSIENYIRQINPDVIHVHFGTDAVDFWPSINRLGKPILVTLHGYDINIYREWWEKGLGGRSRKLYPQRLLQISKDPNVRFIAVSEAIKNRAIAYGIDSKKIDVSYIGVDTTRFFPAGLPINQRKKRVLYVGRMVEKKAPLLLIKVFAKVLENIPDAELVMVGDGPLKLDAEALANELGIDVAFKGVLNSNQIIEELHKAQIFCLPSITAENGDAEGLPIAILEAQACGVPVVTTLHSGNPEGIIEDKSGLCFSEGDECGLENAICQLLIDIDLLNSFSKKAVNASQKFSNVFTSEDMENKIYKSSIKDL